ncbi:MAG TPA: glutathione S-transferase N-terminal domain-containing protein [Casimicrobiaceae bacterium]|nr:glutathione S-transferase N-terminal domain-containing protein [Casimicrobiaceae bacterium]
MELKFSALSPYVRKVTITAHELGIADRIRLAKVDTRNEPEKIAPLNPVGKIPALITDTGAVLFDSVVICEYLTAEFGGERLLPRDGAARYEVLTRTAFADGMTDAAILVRHERVRDKAQQSGDWIDWQLRKVFNGLDYFEARSGGSASLDLGDIALGASLGYMPLRVAEVAGLPRWPRLRAWYEAAAQRESFRATAPVL